jgi:hypothetical protein
MPAQSIAAVIFHHRRLMDASTALQAMWRPVPASTSASAAAISAADAGVRAVGVAGVAEETEPLGIRKRRTGPPQTRLLHFITYHSSL